MKDDFMKAISSKIIFTRCPRSRGSVIITHAKQFGSFSIKYSNFRDVQRPHMMNQAYFAIDVECIASGVEHNSRAVAQISLVVSIVPHHLHSRCLI